MKQTKYTFYFTDGTLSTQYAMSHYQATILAMAEKINKGEDFSIETIKDEEGREYYIVTYMDIDRV